MTTDPAADRLRALWRGLPVVQAALSGYSDEAMRTVARAHGAPFCLNEVVLDEDVLRPGKLRRRILRVAADDHPVGGQLMGSQPDAFGAAAHELVEAGYDVVDVNFGCPVSKVLGRRRGGWLLGDPATALAILRQVVDAVAGRVPLMVKMRRGLDDGARSERDFFRILDGAFALGVAAVTVHGRTVRQKYVGPSRWPFLARVKRHVGDRIVLGSGDLFDAFAVRRMLAETGVDAVTAARGAIGNPWIFDQCRRLLAGGQPLAPTVAQQRAAIELHAARAVAMYGSDAAAGRRVRTHAIKFARHHPRAEQVRDAFVACRTLAEVRSVLAAEYAPGPWPDRPLPLRQGAAARADDGDDCGAAGGTRVDRAAAGGTTPA